jgi:hypothetical protein
VLDINDYTILFHIPQCSQTRYLSHEAGRVQCYDCTGYKDQESDGMSFGYARRMVTKRMRRVEMMMMEGS